MDQQEHDPQALLVRESVITVREAARVLRVSDGVAYEMVRQGRLPSLRLGRRIIVPVPALQRMLEDQASPEVSLRET